METFLLNDGTKIPAIGFGTFQIPADGHLYVAPIRLLNRPLISASATLIQPLPILTNRKSARLSKTAVFPARIFG